MAHLQVPFTAAAKVATFGAGRCTFGTLRVACYLQNLRSWDMGGERQQDILDRDVESGRNEDHIEDHG